MGWRGAVWQLLVIGLPPDFDGKPGVSSSLIYLGVATSSPLVPCRNLAAVCRIAIVSLPALLRSAMSLSTFLSFCFVCFWVASFCFFFSLYGVSVISSLLDFFLVLGRYLRSFGIRAVRRLPVRIVLRSCHSIS